MSALTVRIDASEHSHFDGNMNVPSHARNYGNMFAYILVCTCTFLSARTIRKMQESMIACVCMGPWILVIFGFSFAPSDTIVHKYMPIHCVCAGVSLCESLCGLCACVRVFSLSLSLCVCMLCVCK